jgi:Aspartyl protease
MKWLWKRIFRRLNPCGLGTSPCSADMLYLENQYTGHSLTFSSAKKMATEKALLDSGATENFIDPRMVKKLGIGTVELTQPRMVYNVDRMENQGGQIEKLCILNILQGRKEAAQPFFVINLGEDQLILGYLWLKEFNPMINWMQGTMLGPPIKLGTTGKS